MRKRLLLVGLILLLATPLVPVLKGLVRELITVPILRLIWISQLVFDSIPRLFIWAMFIAISALVAGASLIRLRQPLPEVHPIRLESSGQVRHLTRRIQHMGQDDYFKWSFSQHLRELILKVLAESERTTVEEIKRRVRTGQLAVPSEILAYLQVRRKPTYSRPAGIPKVLRNHLRSNERTLPHEADLARVVQFLEDQLDV
jgi:hypothetical protein